MWPGAAPRGANVLRLIAEVRPLRARDRALRSFVTGGIAVEAVEELGHVAHVNVELSLDELDLVRTGLRMLLDAEDDPETIAELKLLLARLAQAAV